MAKLKGPHFVQCTLHLVLPVNLRSFFVKNRVKIMTTIEICNSYQMSIAVTAIFSFIAGRYCAKGIFFLIVFFFFFCEGSPLLKVRIRTEDVCRYHFLLSIYSSIQYFFSRYDKYNSYYTFHLNHDYLPI